MDARALPAVPHRIADELGVAVRQVEAAVALLDDGATVPFVARYRKEATGNLDDVQLRTLADRLSYLRELEERRAAVAESVAAQGKLTPELAEAIASAQTKARLEDVYLPFKPKRRTKAQIAREAGLEPLLDDLLADPRHNPIAVAAGLCQCRARRCRRRRRRWRVPGRSWSSGSPRTPTCSPRSGSGCGRAVSWSPPSGRAGRATERGSRTGSTTAKHCGRRRRTGCWRLFRGEREGVLELTLDPQDVELGALSEIERMIAASAGIRDEGRAADPWLLDGVRWAWRTRVALRVEGDVRGRLREEAEAEAVRVFAGNLRDLLLAAPAGSRPTMGLDPGLRTGVKVAVVDGTGKVVATDTVYPHPPAKKWQEALRPACRAGRPAPGRAGRDRQRDGVARDGTAGRRAGHPAPGAQR